MMTKKNVLVVVMLLVTTNVWASKVWDVSATTHNLSSGAAVTKIQYRADPDTGSTNEAGEEDEVCIFCHTPHGGSTAGPLWNRNLPGQTFTHYSSATLSNVFSPVGFNTRPVSTESLLCLSCHDGAIGVGTLINYSNRTIGNPGNEGANVSAMWFQTGGAIGDIIDPAEPWHTQFVANNLSDDHPISFSYYDAKNAEGARLNSSASAQSAGIRFFGPNASGGLKVECSSCHDPHVDGNVDTAYKPFLVMSNTGSNLCLACHNK